MSAFVSNFQGHTRIGREVGDFLNFDENRKREYRGFIMNDLNKTLKRMSFTEFTCADRLGRPIEVVSPEKNKQTSIWCSSIQTESAGHPGSHTQISWPHWIRF